jgi:hypothetical protein
MEQPRVFFMILNVLCYCAEKYSEVTALLLCLPCSANRHDILGVLCAPWEHEKTLWHPCTTVATLERTDPMSCHRSTVGTSIQARGLQPQPLAVDPLKYRGSEGKRHREQYNKTVIDRRLDCSIEHELHKYCK